MVSAGTTPQMVINSLVVKKLKNDLEHSGVKDHDRTVVPAQTGLEPEPLWSVLQ